MSVKYLKRGWSYGRGFSFYEVEKETECFYFVRINERCVYRVSKKKIESAFGCEWSVPTEEDYKIYNKRLLISKLQNLIKETDFEKWSDEEIKNLISILRKDK